MRKGVIALVALALAAAGIVASSSNAQGRGSLQRIKHIVVIYE